MLYFDLSHPLLFNCAGFSNLCSEILFASSSTFSALGLFVPLAQSQRV